MSSQTQRDMFCGQGENSIERQKNSIKIECALGHMSVGYGQGNALAK